MTEIIGSVLKHPAFGLVSSLLCLLIGYRLGIANEKRKEYNELADKLFLQVDKQLESHAAHHFYLDDNDIKLVRRRMGFRKRSAFDRAIARFKGSAKNTFNDNGHVHYKDVSDVNEALQQIACLLSRR